MTKLAQKILELRERGLSYKQIVRKLHCARSTVCYYCGTNQKQKFNNRQQKRRNKTSTIARKLQKFQTRKQHVKDFVRVIDKAIKARLRERILRFSFDSRTGRYASMKFTVEQLLEKIGSAPTCYLTGRAIDLTKTRTYHLDHIVPASKGGDNSLKNCGLACREANQAKNDMSVEEFVQLCRDVIAHHETISATENRTPVSTLKGSRPNH